MFIYWKDNIDPIPYFETKIVEIPYIYTLFVYTYN